MTQPFNTATDADFRAWLGTLDEFESDCGAPMASRVGFDCRPALAAAEMVCLLFIHPRSHTSSLIRYGVRHSGTGRTIHRSQTTPSPSCAKTRTFDASAIKCW